ncbi:MAG TPA: lipoyl(octanoyl) transferase LipB [Pelomicrobium sp.]|nr:lipoyl(octanoyl) transferase LipB [Pelomicrobium sp.]
MATASAPRIEPSSAAMASVRRLGRADYVPTWHAMRDRTLARGADSADEIWVVEHPPVYTVGLAGRPEHLPSRADIPVVKVDRGGQITYHGPGQIVVYLLLDLRRMRLAVRPLVRMMEASVIDLLACRGIAAAAREDAPGVYVGGAKIAALGLRVKNGCCYHGLAFNVDMDLSPFLAIDPCGYPGLAVTQARDLGVGDSTETLAAELVHNLQARIHGTR